VFLEYQSLDGLDGIQINFNNISYYYFYLYTFTNKVPNFM